MKVYIICKSATPVLWWIAEQQFYSYSSEVLIHDQRVWRLEIIGQLAPVSAPLSEPGPGPWSCDIPLSNVSMARVRRLRLMLVFILTRAAIDPSVFTITEK